MYNEPPQWPDRPAQPPAGGPSPRRPTFLLALVAVVAGVLILALVGTLIVLLSRGALGGGTQAGLEPSAQAATAAAAGTSNNGQPLSGTVTTQATPSPSPTNTPPSAAATATSTTFVVCCISILPSVHQVVAQTLLNGTDVGPVVANCPAGEIALAGGWATSNRSDVDVYNATRNGTGGWRVYVNHSSSLTVNSYAECLKNASGATIAQRFAQVSVGPGATGSTIASCNAGEVLVGGGYAYNTGLELYNFSAASSSSWGGYAKNHGGAAGLLYIYAECLTYSGAHSSQTAYHQASIAVGAAANSTSNPCPSGTVVSGGGFADDPGAFVYTMSADGSGATWTAYLFADGGIAELLNSYAMCLGF